MVLSLMDACEEQDIKESVLAFFMLAVNRPKWGISEGLSADAIKRLDRGPGTSGKTKSRWRAAKAFTVGK
jgi:hypothetical protein